MTGYSSHLDSSVLTGETVLDTESSHRGFVEADFFAVLVGLVGVLRLDTVFSFLCAQTITRRDRDA